MSYLSKRRNLNYLKIFKSNNLKKCDKIIWKNLSGILIRSKR